MAAEEIVPPESIAQKVEMIDDKFLFNLNDLLTFIFPQNLQHPLAASRLIIFGMYGPLDSSQQLCSGRKGTHVLLEYELDAMCQQIEREDLVQIYLHHARDMGLLSTAEQDMLINQADAHLKKEKGKAMLPRINRDNVINMFTTLPRDDQGRISFHAAQDLIADYRLNRVKQYKLVYPAIISQSNGSTLAATKGRAPQKSGSFVVDGNMSVSSSDSQSKKSHTLHHSHHGISSYTAPATMFQRMKGNTNADLIEQTTQHLSKHGFKITDLDNKTTEITSNVKLLRDIPPRFENPYKHSRKDWNGSSVFKGAGLGSMVNTFSSSSTWKRKYTTY